MLTSLSLKCANCGANLEVKAETNTFACGYCGASQLVERHGGTVSLKLLTESISKVQIGTDKTAAELAIRRLKEEIIDVNNQYSILIANKGRDVNANIKNFFIIGGIVLFFIFIAVVNISGLLAFISTMAAGAGIAVLWYKIHNKIVLGYEARIERVRNQYKTLEAKIVEQKRIVDN